MIDQENLKNINYFFYFNCSYNLKTKSHVKQRINIAVGIDHVDIDISHSILRVMGDDRYCLYHHGFIMYLF